MKTVSYKIILLLLVFFIGLSACHSNDESDAQDEETKWTYAFLLMQSLATCESFAYGNVVQLTQGVSAGPYSERICFVVSTMGNTTVNTTTSGNSEFGFRSFSSNITDSGFSQDDKSFTINEAGTNIKFAAFGMTTGNNFTIIVN